MNDIEEAHNRKVEAFKICCIIYKCQTKENLEELIEETIQRVALGIKKLEEDNKFLKINTEINRMIQLVKFLGYLKEM